MITHVQSVTVFVSDQDKAIDFYVNKLGFELRSDTPMGENMRWVTVAPPGAPTEIVLAKGYGDWSEEQVGKFSRIVFNAEDIEATYEVLRDRGVQFSEPPTAQPWGMTQALFADQDNNGYVMVGQ